MIRVEGGWVVHLFGLPAGAVWSTKKTRLVSTKGFSINLFKLLTTAVAVVLIGKHGRVPEEHRVILRCDKTSVSVGNNGAAYKPAIRFTLRVFMSTCNDVNVTIKLDYIASHGNVIADAISRNNWTEEQKRVSMKGWTFQKQDLNMQLKEWEEALNRPNSLHETLDYLDEKPEGESDEEAHIEKLELRTQ